MKAILLLILSVSVAFAVPGDEEWKKELNASWAEVFRSYPTVSRAECVKIVKKWDQVAKESGHEYYHYSNKPMIFMGLEMDERRRDWAAYAADAPNRERRRIENEERARRSAAEINARIKAIGRPEPRDPVRDLRNDIDDLEREQQHLKSQIRRGW
jgi:hypothetical protein